MFRFKALFSLRVKLILAFIAVIVLAVVLSTHENKEETTPTQGLILSTTESKTTSPEITDENGTTENTEDYTYIILADEMTTINGKGASFSDNQVKITKGGTYFLKGGLSDGRILVDAKNNSEKVVLKLCGVGITSSSSAAIIIKNAPKDAVIHLAEGTINSLTDTSKRAETYVETDEDSSVIFSKDNLVIEGKGTVTVSAGFNKGIFSKKDITFKDATVNVLSADDGIRSKDSIEIAGGKLKITSGGDGIRTKDDIGDIGSKIVIHDSDITITSELDGIESAGDVLMYGSKLSINSNGGSTGRHSDKAAASFFEEPKSPTEDKNLLFALRKATLDSSALEEILSGSSSFCGIAAKGEVTLNETTLKISSVDDAVYAGSIIIENGQYSLSSDDDGLHAVKEVSIKDGEVNIADSYEGIESEEINVDGGKLFIKAYNNGFDTYGKDGTVEIDGGYVHIDSDSKGDKSGTKIELSGGTLIVVDSAADAVSVDSYTVSSGTLLVLSNAPTAKSIESKGIPVIAFTESRKENSLTVIADSEGESVIGFVSPKRYKNVVFVSDSLNENEYYSLYAGGYFDSESLSGIYTSGGYSKGTLLRKLSKPLRSLDKTQ